VDSFTLGAALGVFTGGLASLYALPGVDLEPLSNDLKAQLVSVGDAALVRKLRHDLQKKLWSGEVVLINLLAFLVLVVMALGMLFGPAMLVGWLVPAALDWVLSPLDLIVLGFLFLVQAILFTAKGAVPLFRGLAAVGEARRWLARPEL